MNSKYEIHLMSEEAAGYSKCIRVKAACLDDMLSDIEDCREKSLAMTKLEECVMWANKALATHGLKQT